jgi:CBS domain-containing protein/anti-sigma regulatory factor (Ser/Thr protein kinase)
MDTSNLAGGITSEARVITDQIAGHITRVDELFYELKIADVMAMNPKTISPDQTIEEVLELMRREQISGAPVIQGDQMVGVISIEDLIRALRQRALKAPARQFMTTQVISVHDQHPVIEALKTFTKTRVGRLPVINDDERLVGIITKGDITRGILTALQQDYEEEEVRRYRASHLFEDIISDRTTLILRYQVKAGDFTSGGQASSHIKRALLRLGASPQIARRCGIAVYEAEINLIIHTWHGGTVRVGIEPSDILIETFDDGPGIPDVKMAMTPGFSTASEQAREMGFGAGMGLKNIQRCTDTMDLQSTPGVGTHLKMKIYLRPEDGKSRT